MHSGLLIVVLWYHSTTVVLQYYCGRALIEKSIKPITANSVCLSFSALNFFFIKQNVGVKKMCFEIKCFSLDFCTLKYISLVSLFRPSPIKLFSEMYLTTRRRTRRRTINVYSRYKHITTSCTELTYTRGYVHETSWSYSSHSSQSTLAADQLPHWVQDGDPRVWYTVNRQPCLPTSCGHELYAYGHHLNSFPSVL